MAPAKKKRSTRMALAASSTAAGKPRCWSPIVIMASGNARKMVQRTGSPIIFKILSINVLLENN